jgi:peptidoglycan hydrolase CwlO-like protein
MQLKTVADYKTIDEAVADVNKLLTALADEITAHAATKSALQEEITAHGETQSALADAETAADEAIAQANEALANAPKSYTTTVAGVGKVQVNFGVDKLSKDQLLESPDKIAALVKKGSHAVTVLTAED